MKTERALSSSEMDRTEFSFQLTFSQQKLQRLIGDNTSSHILALATLNRGKMNSAALGNVRVTPGECNAVGSTQVWQKLQTSNKLSENPKPKLNKLKPK